ARHGREQYLAANVPTQTSNCREIFRFWAAQPLDLHAASIQYVACTGNDRHLGDVWVHRLMTAKILCVEDETDLRSDICEELVAAGYAVDEAGNGQEAMTLLRANRYDLVLCDITMPRMSGLDLLRQVRR